MDACFDLIIGVVQLILASASPRRAELLHAAGFAFDVVAVGVDETVRDGESPAAYVRRLAADKSARAQADLKVRTTIAATTAAATTAVVRAFRPAATDDVIILGADTTVVVDGDILGKARDNAEAAAMLRRLSGRRHEVLTGV